MWTHALSIINLMPATILWCLMLIGCVSAEISRPLPSIIQWLLGVCQTLLPALKVLNSWPWKLSAKQDFALSGSGVVSRLGDHGLASFGAGFPSFLSVKPFHVFDFSFPKTHCQSLAARVQSSPPPPLWRSHSQRGSSKVWVGSIPGNSIIITSKILFLEQFSSPIKQ